MGHRFESEAMVSGESDLDLLPEYCKYHDDGCEFADSCLNCPFPDCIYAQPGGRQQWLKSLRDREVLKTHSQGKGVKELAEMFGLSSRTIQRIFKRDRDNLKNQAFGGANE
jgi:DNA-binding CsgD family transcriptional regulator